MEINQFLRRYIQSSEEQRKIKRKERLKCEIKRKRTFRSNWTHKSLRKATVYEINQGSHTIFNVSRIQISQI